MSNKLQFHKNELTVMSKLKYCIYVIEYNQHRFTESDIRYYQGKCENRKPHGIDNFYWSKAWKIVNN